MFSLVTCNKKLWFCFYIIHKEAHVPLDLPDSFNLLL